jgi:hypothetical protein
MKNINLKKSLVALTTSALIAAFAVVIPTTAQAATTCEDKTVLAGKSSISITYAKCVGTDFQGANYEIRMPKKFNGTLFLYSHGIRNQVLLPIIPGVNPDGAYSRVRNMPDVAPGRTAADQEKNALDLLSQGYAVAGASPRVQGWAVPEAIEANMNLLEEVKTLFPKMKKVVSWGDSLGGHISQSMSEQYGVIDATVNLHMAGEASAQFNYAGDVFWLTKVLFDPTMKGSGYTNRFPNDPDGYKEFLGDVTKSLTVLNALATAIGKNPVAPEWPATATNIPASLKAVPVRSAILLLGLLSGIPTQSQTYDASSGPAGPLETTFGVAISPALAVLENYAAALALGTVSYYDAETRCGGVVFDNTATNYAARLGDNGDVFAAALSGKTATNGLLSFLSPLNPAAPRVKGDAKAIECINNQSQYAGKVTVPTITLSQTADNITPAGYVQSFKNKYSQMVASKKAKPGMLLNIWNKPPDTYTKFTAAGSGIAPAVPTTGTTHYMFTNEQVMAVAKLAAAAAKTGKLPSAKTAKSAFKSDSSIFIDPDFTPALLPQDK